MTDKVLGVHEECKILKSPLRMRMKCKDCQNRPGRGRDLKRHKERVHERAGTCFPPNPGNGGPEAGFSAGGCLDWEQSSVGHGMLVRMVVDMEVVINQDFNTVEAEDDVEEVVKDKDNGSPKNKDAEDGDGAENGLTGAMVVRLIDCEEGPPCWPRKTRISFPALIHKKDVHDDENKPEEFDNTVEGEALLGLGDLKKVHGLNRNGKFTCDECGIPAKRIVMKEWHMQSAHVLGRIVCDRCGRMSGGLDGKGRHVGRVHGKPPVDLGQRVRIPCPRAGIRPLPSSCQAPCPPPGSSPVQS